MSEVQSGEQQMPLDTGGYENASGPAAGNGVDNAAENAYATEAPEIVSGVQVDGKFFTDRKAARAYAEAIKDKAFFADVVEQTERPASMKDISAADLVEFLLSTRQVELTLRPPPGRRRRSKAEMAADAEAGA